MEWTAIEHLKVVSKDATGKVLMMSQTKQGNSHGIKICPDYANTFFSGLLMSRLGIKCPQVNPLSQTSHKEEFKRMLLGIDWATRADITSRKVAKQALLGNQVVLLIEWLKCL